jgi:hypothetical protein
LSDEALHRQPADRTSNLIRGFSIANEQSLICASFVRIDSPAELMKNDRFNRSFSIG